MLSAVLIIPTAHLSAINALGSGMGWGPSNYQVPLATDPEAEEPTHFGARVDVTGPEDVPDTPDAPDDFVTLTEKAKAGTLPDLDYEALGTTEADVQAALGALIADFSQEYPRPLQHWQAVLDRYGFHEITPE